MIAETKQVRAQVSQKGLAHVAEFFNQKPDTIIDEVLQNCRRSGAAGVVINVERTNDAERTRVTIHDNGPGIANEESLLTLWESSWDEQTAASESPAGFGFFSLACLPGGVLVETDAWSMQVDQDVFCGRKDATSRRRDMKDPAVGGTRLTFDLQLTTPETHRVITNCCRYYPLPVILNGRDVESIDFLGETDHVITFGGLRIGVFTDVNATLDHPNVNFYGVTCREALHCPHKDWRVKIDVMSAAPIDLVKPARNAVVHNEKWVAVLDLVRKATYLTCARVGEHDLTFACWKEAKEMGIELPEARPRLRRAVPGNIHCCGWSPGSVKDGFTEVSPESWLWDGKRDQLAILHASSVEEVPPMFRPAASYTGYSWYPKIEISDLYQVVSYTGITYADVDGSQLREIQEGNPSKTVDSITLQLIGVNRGENMQQIVVHQMEGSIAVDVDSDGGGHGLNNHWVATQEGLEAIDADVLMALFCDDEDEMDEFHEMCEAELETRLNGDESACVMRIEKLLNAYDFRSLFEELNSDYPVLVKRDPSTGRLVIEKQPQTDSE